MRSYARRFMGRRRSVRERLLRPAGAVADEDVPGRWIGPPPAERRIEDIYVDVETDEPRFATVKEGFLNRHLTFVPLGGIQIGNTDAWRRTLQGE